MINEKSIAAVERSRFSSQFVAPLYGSYCFSNIPQLVRRVLVEGETACRMPLDVLGDMPQRYKKVVLFLVDAFGWRFLQRYKAESPFLKRFEERGVVSKITSQFPSTTAAHVTCLHAGKPVGETGIFEWYFYEPKVDAIISPLLFSFASDGKHRESLRGVLAPEEIFPQPTFYQGLAESGVGSLTFQDRDYAQSSYSQTVLKGSQICPYKGVRQGLSQLREKLQAAEGPLYTFFYIDGFDSLCHTHGPDKGPLDIEARNIMSELEEFYAWASATLQDTLILVTADHGQVEIDPATTFYLDEQIPEFEKYVRRNAKGELLVPGGSARDLFLYLEPGHVDDAFRLLVERLQGRAEVYYVKELLEKGFFGHRVEEALLNRLSDLVVLPYRHESVWWFDKGRRANTFYGHHGGLTPEEMETILLAIAI